MKAVLSNARQPAYGAASIPFPIRKKQYDSTIGMLAGLDIGDAVKRDCKVEEISGEYPILRHLEGTSVNVDELDYLAKRMDSFDKNELAKFSAMAVSQDIRDIKNMINLTFCFQDFPLVRDFTDLEKVGRSCHMDRNGGVLPPESEQMDFRQVALDLLRGEQGQITPYGVIYDEGFQMEQLYDGRHFPQYRYEDGTMEVEVIPDRLPHENKPSTFLSLPLTELQLERALLRGECLEGDIEVRLLDSRLPEEADAAIDFERDDITELNRLCHILSPLKQDDMEKLGAVVWLAKPTSAAEMGNLARRLDLFDFVPGIRTATDYGRHMIMHSGHFEYDENLSDFYDFEKYGRQRMEEEYGQFNDRGYVSYHGVVSMEELLAGVPCERMDMTMEMG